MLGVWVSGGVLKSHLPPLFLKIGLWFWFFHHNFVVCTVTAITLCMLQVYTNSLVLFYGFVLFCSYMLSVMHVRSNVMWSKIVGKIRESLWGCHNHNIGFCDFFAEQNQDNRHIFIWFKQKSSVVSKLVNNTYIVHGFPEWERLCNIMMTILFVS